MVLLKELVEEAERKYALEKKKNRVKKKKKRGRKSNKIHWNQTQKQLLKYKPTGFYNLYRNTCDECIQGFYWKYISEDLEVARVDFFELKKIVLENGQRWEIKNRNDALHTSRIIGLPLYDLIKKD